jgi:hypothetical protein
MFSAPKYGKIELFLRDGNTETFNNCGMVITGDNLIIVIDEKDSIANTEVSNGTIFPISQIASYKTHKD